MFKNVASQKVTLLAIDTVNNVPKTGDSANITPYYQLDDGTVTAISAPSVTETDATNLPGLYTCTVSQGETNGDKIIYGGKSSTTGIRIVPVTVYAVAANFSSLSIDSGGVAKASLAQVLGTAFTEDSAGYTAAAFKKFFNKATPTGTINSIPDAVAGATNGLLIAGTNAATTITTALTTTFTGNLTGSVGSISGTLGTIDAIYTKIKKLAALLARKDAGAATDFSTELGEINANGGSGAGSFANTTDSLQAIEDNGLTVSGSVNVASIDNDVITAASIANDAIAEIQAGLATPTNITAGTITTVTTLTNKTGFSLASTGLDAVAAPADLANDAAGRATFIGMFRALYNRFYNRVNQTATQQKVYADNSTTVVSTSTVSDDSTTQEKLKSA